MENDQLGSNVNLVFDSRSTGWAETNIMGTSQVIGNVRQGTNANNWRANIQNHSGSDSYANGTLTITQTENIAFTGNVRDRAGTPGTSKLNIVKDGAGTLRLLNATNTTNPYSYGGSTTVNDGTLAFDFDTNGSGNVSPRTSGITLNTNDAAGTSGVLEFNVGSGIRDLEYDLSVSGNGTVRKTGDGTIQWGTTAATFNLDAGSWIDQSRAAPLPRGHRVCPPVHPDWCSDSPESCHPDGSLTVPATPRGWCHHHRPAWPAPGQPGGRSPSLEPVDEPACGFGHRRDERVASPVWPCAIVLG